jgi:hypothetical protein
LLHSAEPYELTDAASGSCIYRAYVGGQAFLALRNGAAAASEFQKILSHNGIVKTCETGSLARLDLAQAYVPQSDITKAKLTFQDFLTLWNDAGPDIPNAEAGEGRVCQSSMRNAEAIPSPFCVSRNSFQPVPGVFTPLLAKHSKSFSLIDCISVGVARMQRNFEPMRKQVEAWQKCELAEVRSKVVTYDAFVEGKLEAPKYLARTA